MALKIILTGSTGLVGSTLKDFYERRGHQVTPVVRSKEEAAKAGGAHWDQNLHRIDPEPLEDHDAVIHLAGANISAGRWTEAYKKTIRNSRVDGTRVLCKTLAGLKKKPRVLLSASAVGIYGSREPDDAVDETARHGQGFLADVCREWEAATAEAERAGIRVAHLRFGVVLSPKGGALAKMLPIFKTGLGGPIASGEQMMSWVALDEIPYLADHLIQNSELSGPVNVVSPRPVSNGEFTRVLGDVLKKPARLPVPAFALRLLYGEMADALLINGVHVEPAAAQKDGYEFRHPVLKTALEKELSGR